MTKTKLRIEKSRDPYLSQTHVENIFINELMPVAPGEYVKVYLFCLMYAERGEAVSTDMIAKTLGISTDEVDKAWEYWEEWGAVRRFGTDGCDGCEVVFANQAEEFYNRSSCKIRSSDGDEASADGDSYESYTAEASGLTAEDGDIADADDADEVLNELTDREMRAVFDEYEQTAGRAVSRTETNKISDTITLYGVTPDVFSYAIKYSAELGNYNIDYIKTVALRWKSAGCLTIADAKAYVDKYSRRLNDYKRIFSEVGFSRLPNPGDKEMMDRWLDEWGLPLSDILEACKKTAGIREPSLRYVDKVLENRMLKDGGIKPGPGSGGAEGTPQAKVSRKVLEEYYKYLREEADRKYRERIKAVSEKLPVMQKIITDESEVTRDMLSIRPGPDARESIKRSRARLAQITDEKKRVLAENGYPCDHLERRYKCEVCRDTGITDDGRYCSCAKERADEAYIWNKTRNQ